MLFCMSLFIYFVVCLCYYLFCISIYHETMRSVCIVLLVLRVSVESQPDIDKVTNNMMPVKVS